MDRSVDSIGTCSLDAEASVILTDQSDQSSLATLRSINFSSTEPHLPSYLSLACTVNGYSTTTNYNSERLSKSRDASPHRLLDSDLTTHSETPEYTVRNNLLSPPNIVPLPSKKSVSKAVDPRDKMANQSISHHDYFSTSSRNSFQTHESKIYMSTACVNMGQYTSKCLSSVSSSTSSAYMRNNLECKAASHKDLINGTESKSFIQQRVERLYGPGALAQGFFISKRLQSRSFDTSNKSTDLTTSTDKHSTSLEEGAEDSAMKQSFSTPTLPVLRHLRPEFRAQLPAIGLKKSFDSVVQKKITSDTPKSQNVEDSKKPSTNGVNTNGLTEENHEKHLASISETHQNGDLNSSHPETTERKEDAVKDGHYFLEVLDKETERLLKLADQVEGELDILELTEEVKGKLRSASGKARLLTSQKMQQFRGLCTKNITRSDEEAFPTTNEDLQGFWDMVSLQIEQVDMLFQEINKLRSNNWVEEESEDTTDRGGKKSNGFNGVAKQKKVAYHSKHTNAANQEARKQRDALRKQMIEAKRKAMKEQQNQDNIQIFVPESS